MSDTTMFATNRETNHVDRLYKISSLAKAGAASTDSTLNLEHMEESYRAVFEVIYSLAGEAIEIAEIAQSATHCNS